MSEAVKETQMSLHLFTGDCQRRQPFKVRRYSRVVLFHNRLSVRALYPKYIYQDESGDYVYLVVGGLR
jgi:hypothetical protein